MAHDHARGEANVQPNAEILPILLPLFVLSGCAALIYEVVWLELLQLVIGSTAISMGVLLATYMGGMCIGSLAAPRYISARTHPLLIYAFLEAAIGGMGLAIVYGVPYVERLYTMGAGSFVPTLVLRAIVSVVCLLPPTVAMGATLPAISRWVEATPRGVAWLGFLYAGNIAGGVVGCLLAGFYLLRLFNVVKATHVAFEINFVAAFAGAVLARATKYDPSASRPSEGRSVAPPTARSPAVYVSIALSGVTALGAEVVWTRLLSLTLGATVYTFSLILAVFLIGLGLGSGLGLTSLAFAARGAPGARVVPALARRAIAWGAYGISESLPYWPTNPSLAVSPWYTFQLDVVRCAWAILPPASGGARAFHSLSRRSPHAARIRGGWWPGRTRPTRSVPSPERRHSACCWSPPSERRPRSGC